MCICGTAQGPDTALAVWPGCPFSEDGLTSKRIFPGASHRTSKVSKQSCWATRLSVTTESFLLWLDLLGSQQRLSSCRRKLTKQQLEEKSETCAVAWHLGNELMRDSPASADEVDK